MEAIMNVMPHHTENELKTFYRRETNARLARRLQGVYLARKGLTCPDIMEITGASRRTIQQWVAKYNVGGIEALQEAARPGQPTLLPRLQEQAFCQRIETGPKDQDHVSVLNGPAIQRILDREFGVRYTLWGTYHLLHRLGYSCLCPRPQHEKADPHAQEAFKKTSAPGWIKSNQSIPRKK